MFHYRPQSNKSSNWGSSQIFHLAAKVVAHVLHYQIICILPLQFHQPTNHSDSKEKRRAST